METVNNLTSAASRAIWGDSTKESITDSATEEPVSGEMGIVKAGEPYDKGNLSENVEDKNTEERNATETSLATRPAKYTSETDVPDSAPAGSSYKTSSSNDNNGSGSEPRLGAGVPSRSDKNDKGVIKEQHHGVEKPEANVEKGSDENEQVIATNTETGEAVQLDISGAGPRMLKGNADSIPTTKSTEEDDGSQKVLSHGTGASEKHVKGTGLKADGGNVDAAAPGADREADGLLENKVTQQTGTLPETDEHGSKASSKDGVSGGKEKLSFKEKIKAKLHNH